MKNNFVFFLFSPFLGLIQAIKHYRESWARNSIWLFVIFYGYTMYRPEIMDSSRYVAKLQELYNAPVSWDAFLSNFYSDETGTVDIYQPLVTYLLSFFTNNGNVLFAVFGILFGFFYSRNIWLLLDLSKKQKMTVGMVTVLIAFCCVIGFWNLNGVRMWTAAHMFFYGAFLLLVNGNKKGVIVAVLSILVHFSFVLPVGILLLFYFVKIPWRILYFFFISSFFISSLNIESIRSRLESVAPDFLLPRVKSYTSDEYVETISDLNATGNWYITYYSISINWYIMILFTIIYFSKSKFSAYSKSFSNLFGFSLLFLSVGNITSLLPSGNRYLLVAQLFATALLFFYYVVYEDREYRKWAMLCSPLLFFFIIVSVRMSFDTISLMTILTNPVLATIVDLPIPLIDLIK
ncbi:EpsG family protein [Flavobacterium sp.]|uniref:EpsG family protein n=1 Tax=Flavobacterium sp. TaxID=239 RepID=UPI00261DE7F5|nr:EpsG family protein [Flavobacterium sp.]